MAYNFPATEQYVNNCSLSAIMDHQLQTVCKVAVMGKERFIQGFNNVCPIITYSNFCLIAFQQLNYAKL